MPVELASGCKRRLATKLVRRSNAVQKRNTQIKVVNIYHSSVMYICIYIYIYVYKFFSSVMYICIYIYMYINFSEMGYITT